MVGTKSGRAVGSPNLVLYRIVALLHESQDAAVQMTAAQMELAKIVLDRKSFEDLREFGGIQVKEGETLGHFAARMHVEYAVSLLQGRYLEGGHNDYKREILKLQDEKGVTVGEICMAKVIDFLRRENETGRTNILF